MPGTTIRIVPLAVLVVVAEILLAAFGLVHTPEALGHGGVLALAAVAVAQALCVLMIWRGPLSAGRVPPLALRTGAVTGAVTGVLYGVVGLSEYLSSAVTDASTTVGWVIVIGIVASAVVAAAVATARSRSMRAGVAAAFYNAIVEYLVWYPFVLVCYYLFRTSTAIDRVWRAEGIYDDFARSGLEDIRVFVLQDFWGAGFFHLIAGLVIAAVFGTAAAWAVRGLRRAPGPVPGSAKARLRLR
ncbi:hypothetical protein [Sphaerisporangium sp. NPDC051011]|uniref:hypothetical protein n=1 Tax=Sphaerisporangium sp. NPDC051011 TaxID=3155792 RepID=UPI00340DF7A1